MRNRFIISLTVFTLSAAAWSMVLGEPIPQSRAGSPQAFDAHDLWGALGYPHAQAHFE
jgi:hypothetical protein